MSDSEDSKLVTGQVLEIKTGEILGGTYRVQAKIGIGAMGVVYRAEDVKLRRGVAMKFLNPVIADSKEVVELFRSEARALARLNHHGIVQVYSFGEEMGFLYFVMELLSGETLQSRIASHGRYLPRMASQFLRQIAEALQASHEVGMIHRDLKPANVMILPGDRVKVMDFGLAGVAASAGGRAVGTPRYMAPEQAQGLVVDARADIYALGVIAYELLVGDVPYEGANYRKTLEMHVHSPVPSPRQRRPDVPREWDFFVQNLLQKSPADRPESAADVIKRLDALEAPEKSAATKRPEDAKVSAEKLYQKARAHFDIAEYETARRLLHDLFDVNRNHAKGWNLVGAVELKSHRHPEASKAFAKAFALEPDFFEAALNLGQALLKQQRYNEAIWAFDHAVKLMPSLPAPWIQLGEARLAMRDLPGARKAWERAMELDQHNAGLKKRFEELKKAMAL